jgi:uncharacterized protein YlzI (FlbEa/FlbD family)
MWALIHLGYSPTNDMKKALTLGLFAKFQAEESHEVGESTDVVIVCCNEKKLIIKQIDQKVIDIIRGNYKKFTQSTKRNC